MPEFFFDIHDGETHVRDDEGTALPDREAARKAALEILPHLAREGSVHQDRRDIIVDVRDDTGRVIYTACLSLVARWID